jgi:hydrogenase maturation protease
VKQASSSRVAVIGIGNDLAGDDGAGLEVIRLLEPAWQNDGRVLLYRLEGDLLAVADLLPLTSEFVFVDAVVGKVAGELIHGAKVQRAYAPSFHQTDIALVMQSLEALKLVEPFPRWALWGITILLPEELRHGLSPAVERATRELAGALDAHLRELLNGSS